MRPTSLGTYMRAVRRGHTGIYFEKCQSNNSGHCWTTFYTCIQKITIRLWVYSTYTDPHTIIFCGPMTSVESTRIADNLWAVDRDTQAHLFHVHVCFFIFILKRTFFDCENASRQQISVKMVTYWHFGSSKRKNKSDNVRESKVVDIFQFLKVS